MYEWDISKFISTRGQWDSVDKQRSFMDNLAKILNITDPTGWYNITAATLKQHGGESILAKHKFSPSALLASVYPEYPHDDERSFISVPIHGTSLSSDMSQIVIGTVSLINEPFWTRLLAL